VLRRKRWAVRTEAVKPTHPASIRAARLHGFLHVGWWRLTSQGINSSSLLNATSPTSLAPKQEAIMEIKVDYNELEQTENLCGNFVFIREGNRIRNLEAKW